MPIWLSSILMKKRVFLWNVKVIKSSQKVSLILLMFVTSLYGVEKCFNTKIKVFRAQ